MAEPASSSLGAGMVIGNLVELIIGLLDDKLTVDGTMT